MLFKGKLSFMSVSLIATDPVLHYNSNFTAPIKKQLIEGINVLDSGCGPATWTFEMGETYPRSKIYGIDISCVFPESIMPPNVEFSIGNVAKEIPYEDNFFDFAHQRLLVLGLTDDDWTNVIARAQMMHSIYSYSSLI